MGNVGRLVSAARSAAGLTQAELAARAGTSQAAIARYENNTVSPAVATLERIMRAAGSTLELSTTSAPQANLSGVRAACLRRHRKEVLRLVRHVGARNVRLFGSVARGDSTGDSDIDLLVDFDSTAGLLPILHLSEQLSVLLGYKVDVAPADMLRDDVAASAHAEAVPL
jgi:uncharacterized protein